MATEKLFDKLTPENFLLYASKNYDNPGCANEQEFFTDVARGTNVRKNIVKYVRSLVSNNPDSFNLRLIINDIQILINVFGSLAASRMLVFKLESDRFLLATQLKAFLVWFNCPQISELNKVSVDKKLLMQLREMEG